MESIRQFVIDELLGGRTVGDDDNLLLNGMVDSMGVMRLVRFLEDQFGFEVPPQDVTIENFMSIQVVHAYATTRTAT